VPHEKVKLPKRHVKKNGGRPQYPLRSVPEVS
jgi:hypothetical protein